MVLLCRLHMQCNGFDLRVLKAALPQSGSTFLFSIKIGATLVLGVVSWCVFAMCCQTGRQFLQESSYLDLLYLMCWWLSWYGEICTLMLFTDLILFPRMGLTDGWFESFSTLAAYLLSKFTLFDCWTFCHGRVKTNPKNAINEHFLARFLDFVIWGHEHECLIDPQVLFDNIFGNDLLNGDW
jgi:hypothetical protein